jgi:hypothetical protein
MASQLATSRTLTAIVTAALVGLGILALFGNLDGTEARFCCPLGATATEAIAVLPSVVLAAAMQALLTCVFDHPCLLQILFQILVSFWLPLLVIVAAILLPAVFRGKIEVFPASGKCFRK